MASLPPYYQAQVTAGIEVASVDAARVTIEQLREMARRCAEPTPTPRPPPTPQTTPTPPTPPNQRHLEAHPHAVRQRG